MGFFIFSKDGSFSLLVAGLLALEIYFLARISGKTFFDVFYFPRGAAKIF